MNSHPLDPLTSEEFSTCSKLIRDNHPNPAGWIFNSILLQEPPKNVLLPLLMQDVKDFTSHGIPRKAFAILIEKGSGNVFEALVNLTEGKVERFDSVPRGFQPTLSPEDCFESERIAKEDAQVQRRCQELGLGDMSLVVGDPWSVGYNAEPEFEGKRLVQLFMYCRMFSGDNHYAHPLDFVVVVDLNAGQVVTIDDLPIHCDFKARRDGTPTVPKATDNYDPEFFPQGTLRQDVKPLHVVQPEGPSYSMDGNELSWQKFRMRLSFNYREGLVLHNVSYQDGPTRRPLFYRLSLSEMVVPYGDPRPPFHRKCAFDLGDYGLGFCANSLLLGCDCLGTIKYLDGILNTHDGEPTTIKNAVCIHEEDAGTLHKHTEFRTGKVCVTRSRRLVLSFIVTVVNYEYAFYWTFYQDGTINFEVKATGELSTNMLAPGATPANYGTVVFPQIDGQYHQHIFCMRMDPMIDGEKNTVTVAETETLKEPFGSAQNPYGQGFTVTETPLTTARSAQSDTCSATNRFWKICNEGSVHPFTGKPVAWKLMPNGGAFSGLLAGPDSFIRKRAGFAGHSLWVTKSKENELYAGGLYINQSKGGHGLDTWANTDDNVKNEDIVVWHSFGVTHIPRVEDFPIMPVETTGFTLKPCNFFTSNPGLDVPPPDNKSSASVLAEKFSTGCCQ